MEGKSERGLRMSCFFLHLFTITYIGVLIWCPDTSTFYISLDFCRGNTLAFHIWYISTWILNLCYCIVQLTSTSMLFIIKSYLGSRYPSFFIKLQDLKGEGRSTLFEKLETSCSSERFKKSRNSYLSGSYL